MTDLAPKENIKKRLRSDKKPSPSKKTKTNSFKVKKEARRIYLMQYHKRKVENETTKEKYRRLGKMRKKYANLSPELKERRRAWARNHKKQKIENETTKEKNRRLKKRRQRYSQMTPEQQKIRRDRRRRQMKIKTFFDTSASSANINDPYFSGFETEEDITV